ncbi:MAG: ornithine carbamoyltransferase [Rhodospirillaceae bacterium]|nr:ornithine carbamoyltransferase [Rhodospirillaceae bacterium]
MFVGSYQLEDKVLDNIRHFLDIDCLDHNILKDIISQAIELKASKPKNFPSALGKTLALIFEKPSTRTRVSFEVGMLQLGGNVVILNDKETQLSRGETVADTSRLLSRYADIIMLRTDKHKRLNELAANASVPVINGLTDNTHPCQIMADILTFQEHRGNIENKTVAWVGDGNNVATSWLHASTKFGFKLRIATPKNLEIDEAIILEAKNNGGEIDVFNDPFAAVADADCVLTDTWLSMGAKKNNSQVKNLLKPFQVNSKLMETAKANAVFMHCLPAHRGEEVTAEVIDGPQSLVWDEAENRLHVQKAIILWCLGK